MYIFSVYLKPPYDKDVHNDLHWIGSQTEIEESYKEEQEERGQQINGK